MRKGAKVNNVQKYGYFFQVGANAKDEITLECGSFDMKGIMCMANETRGQNDKIQFKNTEADAGGAQGFGIKGDPAKPSEAYFVVAKASTAQKTLQYIDEFIAAVRFQACCPRRNPKSYGKHHT